MCSSQIGLYELNIVFITIKESENIKTRTYTTVLASCLHNEYLDSEQKQNTDMTRKLTTNYANGSLTSNINKIDLDLLSLLLGILFLDFDFDLQLCLFPSGKGISFASTTPNIP